MSMDRSTGAERERVAQQERADARERVQAAQDQEVATRVEQRVEQQRRADEYAQERARKRSRTTVAGGDRGVSAASAARDPVEREDEGVAGDRSLRPDGSSA